MRVLVAEDDPGLRSVLGRGLRENGYAVDTVADGDEALAYIATYDYELAVLDWRMPKRSGLEVLRELRRQGSALRVLMLTARDATSDRVTGLDEGADDYLVKPFELAELLARLRALQRRAPQTSAPCLVVGDLELDPAAHVVTAGASDRARAKGVVVTNTEYRIVDLLMRKSPAVVGRRSIALSVWPEEADALGSNTIDVHMARLRSKLAAAGSSARIETVRGVGYRIVAGEPR